MVQDIRKEGARMVGVVGQPPIGCVPVVITVTSVNDDSQQRCNESLSSVGFDYNQKLKKMLKKMDDSKFRVIYADIYDPMIDMVKNPSKYVKLILFMLCNPSTLLALTIQNSFPSDIEVSQTASCD
ncbi:hypothetical protein ACS0TY_018103 [Phlomoides rotata]